ncbi:MAG: DUF3656 domain-containing protein [Acholeplasma sp.]|nr:DUF3656 domain-containing protein [Acholeplasma sp.]
MHKVELLAPAGTKTAFIGAINAGANAIFMAGHKYGARAFAENFSEQDLIEAIEYAHIRGVSVFMVVNTLMFDTEIKDVLAYTDQLVKNHIDALIVQDLGLIKLFCERYPNTPIHASTQVNVHHVSQVKYLKSLGVKRVILARETSLDMIKKIKKEVDIELEVFIHGALCVSYSGNCLISSILNQRSGNRGMCSYNCRLPYQLLKNNEVISEASYLMSAKDLMTIEYINDLIDAGIDSFKIEGRMRKAEYVIQTVKSYRSAMDAYIEHKKIDVKSEIDKLKRVFNRDYTKGYMFKEVPKDINNDFRPNHIGIIAGDILSYHKGLATVRLVEPLKNGDGFRVVGDVDYGNDVTYMENSKGEIIKEAFSGQVIKLEVKQTVIPGSKLHKTTDSSLEKSLQIYLNPYYKLIPLKGFIKAFVGKPLELSLTLNGQPFYFESKELIAQALSHPSDETMITDSFKLGETPFYFQALHVFTDRVSFVPKKVLTDLRKQMISALIISQTTREKRLIETKEFLNGFQFDEKERMIVKVHTKEQLKSAIESSVETIYYDDIIDVSDFNYEGLIPVKKRIIDNEKDHKITEPSVINEIGTLIHNDHGHNLYAEEFLNVTNIYTAALLSQSHVERITLSSELDQSLIEQFSDRYLDTFKERPNLEMVVYGKKDLMISKYCPVAKTFSYKPNCNLCFKDQYALKDQNNGTYALLNDGNCNMRVMDVMPINLMAHIDSLRKANVKTFRLDFTTENAKQTKEIIKAFRQKMANKPVSLTIERFRTGRFI